MSVTPEFAFIPDYSAQIGVNPRISKVEFGDGYTQRIGKGFNNQLERVSLTFSGRTDNEATAIINFFKERGGVTPFTARIGLNDPIRKYVTDGEWRRSFDQYNYNTITVEFQEVP